MGGYDGSIRIDTSIDPKGFNAGIAGLSKALSAIGKVLSGVVIALSVGVVAALVVIAGAIGLAFRGFKEVAKYTKYVDELNTSFDNLKTSIGYAFAPLIMMVIPYIKLAVDWLITMFNTISMVIGALLGQKTVMQAVAGAGQKAADATDSMAKNTAKAKKEGQGALAAFDEINVLQKKEEPASSTGGGVGVGSVASNFKEVAINPEILTKVAEFKDKVREAYENIKLKAIEMWDSIKVKASDAWDWLVLIWGKVAAWFEKNIIGPLREPFNNLIETVIDCFNRIKSSFIDPLVYIFVTYLWPIIQRIFATIGTFIGNTISIIVALVKTGIATMTAVITSILNVLSGIIQFITGVFTGNWKLAWDGIVKIFSNVFSGIVAVAKGIINLVIDLLNGLMRAYAIGVNAIIGGLNSIKITVPDWVQSLTGIGSTWGMNIRTITAPQIPRLATGAVIPPNAAFAAILGDQKSGTNIEAPEGLIRQIIQEEMSNAGGGDVNVTMPVYLDSEKIYEGQKRIQRRHGTSLVKGTV